VFCHFTEEPDGYSSRVVQQQTNEENKYIFLLTLLIVCDLDGELFPGLQARVEPGGVRTRRGQRHAGARERTLRDGVSDGRPAMIWRA
jgi:hypothetical protein